MRTHGRGDEEIDAISGALWVVLFPSERRPMDKGLLCTHASIINDRHFHRILDEDEN